MEPCQHDSAILCSCNAENQPNGELVCTAQILRVFELHSVFCGVEKDETKESNLLCLRPPKVRSGGIMFSPRTSGWASIYFFVCARLLKNAFTRLIPIFCGSVCSEANRKLGASHIQDGCYGGHIENTKSAITPEQIAPLSRNFGHGYIK
jgi:hypothetical protein